MHEDTFRQMRALLAALERQLAAPTGAADATGFPALERQLDDSRERLAALHEDHEELKAMLAELAATLERPAGPERDEQVAVQARDLADLLAIHIRKEEALAFGLAGCGRQPRDPAEPAARRPPAEAEASRSDPAPPEKGTPR
jgi:hypothetical protein